MIDETNRRCLMAALASWAAAALIAACGGGSSPAVAPPPPPVSQPAVDVSTVAVADPGSALAPGWQHGAFMEIFVRSYQDSGGDGVGDLKGLISRLDYLKGLGISGIWLMPVAQSQDGDHGYAVSNYRAIETAYGTLADFDELIKQAHARGIGVIVDYVMNHSAAQNPLFINSSVATTNPYRDWYVWQATAPTGWDVFGGNPWRTSTTGSYYAPFWDQMPDFNLLNQAVVSYHQDNLRFWLNRGTDGFRFDAVGNLVENGPSAWADQPQNLTLMAGMRTLLDGYSQRYMVCEGPGNPPAYGVSCGSAFAFDLRPNIVAAATGNAGAVSAVANYFKTAPTNLATMVSNHDSFAGQRLWDQVAGNVAQYKLAAATYLLLPGTPFIYYGEEVGMAGGAGMQSDAALRTPMSWTADTGNAGFTTGAPYRALSANVAAQNAQAQANDPNSLLAFYKSMLALRNARPSLAQGSYVAPFANQLVLGYQRSFGGERSLVVINYATAPAAAVALAGLPANATLTSVYPNDGTTATADANGQAQLTLAAQSVRVYDVR